MCQWWVPLLSQAAAQIWLCSGWEVPVICQDATRVTSLSGMEKLISGLFGSGSVTPVGCQAAKVYPLLLPARTVTVAPVSYSPSPLPPLPAS